MQAHLIQMKIAWEDRDANIAHVDALLEGKTNPGDLVVLPELFDSGFSLNVPSTHDANNETADAIKALAKRLQVTVHGSRTILGDDSKGRNQAYIAGPDGRTLAVYDKVHPFSFGREPEQFTGGESITTYDWTCGDESLRICPAVCYDLRFPELFRAGLAQGAQCFVLGANWPSARTAHWRALCIARAIENQAFVIGVNRAGPDPHLDYDGASMAIDPKGEILLEMGAEEGVGSVEIDPKALEAWRAQFPAWKDGKAWLAGHDQG